MRKYGTYTIEATSKEHALEIYNDGNYGWDDYTEDFGEFNEVVEDVEEEVFADTQLTLSGVLVMRTELNSKDYVTFARRFVKETVATMDIEELRGIVIDHIHEEIQEGENNFGQEGAFEEMMAWSEDVFLDVAKDFDLEFEGA